MSLYLAAQQRWPAILLAISAFEDHCAKQDPAPHHEEIYLTCAYRAGIPEAITTLERDYLDAVRRTLMKKCSNPSLLEDVLQQLRLQLLVQPLGGYGGRGQLLGWLCICALRELHKQRCHQARWVALGHIPPQQPALEEDPETDFLRCNQRRVLQEGLRQALMTLSPRQQELLRLQVQGHPVAALGARFEVHRVTVSRWVAELRQQLRQALLRYLAQQGYSTSLLHSLCAEGDLLALLGDHCPTPAG